MSAQQPLTSGTNSTRRSEIMIAAITDGFIMASNGVWFKTLDSEAPPETPMQELNALVDAQDLQDHIIESMVLILKACSLSANTIEDITAKAEEKIKNEQLADTIPDLPEINTCDDATDDDLELTSFLNTPAVGNPDFDEDESESFDGFRL
jgi:hypothetical protein